MTRKPMPGPFRGLRLGDSIVPLYMLPFDKRGVCRGPRTRDALVQDLSRASYTHIFICSHGWNNTFEQSLARYEEFVTGYHEFVQVRRLPRPDPYRPVVVGISWPSIDLIFPGEKPPQIAAAPVPTDITGTDARIIVELGDEAPADVAARFYDLAGQESLAESDAWELAGVLASLYPVGGDEMDTVGSPVTAETVMDVWARVGQAGFGADAGQPSGPDSFEAPLVDRPAPGEPSFGGGPQPAAPQAAGKVRLAFDPRDILRAFTVCKMKDRAGVVGSVGVAPLLRDLLTADSDVQCHLTGHSYGCRVLLSALSQTRLPHQADSVLLLEPAVNYLCFAKRVPKIGRPGGYRPALEQVRQPVLSTFSSRDVPLHDFFQIAVRRRPDLGEVQFAGFGQIPSLYCALGGWGPGGLDAGEAAEVILAAHPDRYKLGADAAPVRVYGVKSDIGIHGHSDVVNDYTFWALYNQVTA